MTVAPGWTQTTPSSLCHAPVRSTPTFLGNVCAGDEAGVKRSEAQTKKSADHFIVERLSAGPQRDLDPAILLPAVGVIGAVG